MLPSSAPIKTLGTIGNALSAALLRKHELHLRADLPVRTEIRLDDVVIRGDCVILRSGGITLQVRSKMNIGMGTIGGGLLMMLLTVASSSAPAAYQPTVTACSRSRRRAG
jgi:hypothetical protein